MTEPNPGGKIAHDLQEEDAHLPNWWLAILFGTMVFGFGYWLVFHTTSALPNPPQPYQSEVAVVKKDAAAKAAATAAAVTAAEGPASIELPQLTISTEAADIEKGKGIFATKGCVACHLVGGGKLVGPDLKGVLARRPQPWVMRMIIAPDVMLKEDETAKDLLKLHIVPMTNQKVDLVQELPFILAYLKSHSQPGEQPAPPPAPPPTGASDAQ